MSSQVAERLGVQAPQIVLLPADVHSLAAAEEAIELADAYGVCGGSPLDEFQKFTLRAALGEREDGSWAASTVANFCARQNGKNDTLAARELAGLILFEEQLILHTAHEFPTANESFLRLVAVFEAWDDLRSKVARIRYANGEQGIELLSGQRLKYKARTGGSGRGFAKADLVVYDEAQHLKAEHLAASGPTRLANPNSQAWFMGSGGLSTSLDAWRMRRRALAGEAGRFAYVEHTAEDVRLVGGRLETMSPDVLDREAWAKANPAYGYRITDEALQSLYDELGPELFGRECLCLWEPDPGDATSVFPADVWAAVCGDHSPETGIILGVDINPDRSHASIVAADPKGNVELIQRGEGTGWVVGRVSDLWARWSATVAVDSTGPAKSLLPDLEAMGIPVEKVSEMSAASAAFYDRVFERRVQVRQSDELDLAVAGAVRKVSGDVWRWDRRTPTVDISPLVAATVAVWVAAARPGMGFVSLADV